MQKNDLISRKQTLEEFTEQFRLYEGDKDEKIRNDVLAACINIIENLPTAAEYERETLQKFEHMEQIMSETTSPVPIVFELVNISDDYHPDTDIPRTNEKTYTYRVDDGKEIEIYAGSNANGDFTAYPVGEEEFDESVVRILTENSIERLKDEIREEEKAEKAVREFLRKEIAEYCDENGELPVYLRTTYDDYLKDHTFSEIASAYQKYSDNYEKGDKQCEKETFPNFFDDYVRENIIFDRLIDEERELYDKIMEDAQEDDELYDMCEAIIPDFSDFIDIASAEGYNGTNYDISEIVDEYEINIMFATKSEKNYDMGAIPAAFGSDRPQESDFDNALVYLIHQQGHTVKEVMDAMHDLVKIHDNAESWYSNVFKKMEEYSEKGFAESVAFELYNDPDYGMTEVTALVSIKGMEGLEVYDALVNNNGNVELSADTNIGLYNEWQGAGSMFEIHLDKPLVIPTEMVRHIQIEGGARKVGEYTVRNTYDKNGGAWKGEIAKTEEQPELVKEDIDKLVKDIKAKNKETKERE